MSKINSPDQFDFTNSSSSASLIKTFQLHRYYAAKLNRVNGMQCANSHIISLYTIETEAQIFYESIKIIKDKCLKNLIQLPNVYLVFYNNKTP